MLFTNHLAENRKSQQMSWSAAVPCGEDVVQTGCD